MQEKEEIFFEGNGIEMKTNISDIFRNVREVSYFIQERLQFRMEKKHEQLDGPRRDVWDGREKKAGIEKTANDFL